MKSPAAKSIAMTLAAVLLFGCPFFDSTIFEDPKGPKQLLGEWEYEEIAPTNDEEDAWLLRTTLKFEKDSSFTWQRIELERDADDLFTVLFTYSLIRGTYKAMVDSIQFYGLTSKWICCSNIDSVRINSTPETPVSKDWVEFGSKIKSFDADRIELSFLGDASNSEYFVFVRK